MKKHFSLCQKLPIELLAVILTYTDKPYRYASVCKVFNQACNSKWVQKAYLEKIVHNLTPYSHEFMMHVAIGSKSLAKEILSFQKFHRTFTFAEFLHIGVHHFPEKTHKILSSMLSHNPSLLQRLDTDEVMALIKNPKIAQVVEKKSKILDGVINTRIALKKDFHDPKRFSDLIQHAESQIKNSVDPLCSMYPHYLSTIFKHVNLSKVLEILDNNPGIKKEFLAENDKCLFSNSSTRKIVNAYYSFKEQCDDHQLLQEKLDKLSFRYCVQNSLSDKTKFHDQLTENGKKELQSILDGQSAYSSLSGQDFLHVTEICPYLFINEAAKNPELIQKVISEYHNYFNIFYDLFKLAGFKFEFKSIAIFRAIKNHIESFPENLKFPSGFNRLLKTQSEKLEFVNSFSHEKSLLFSSQQTSDLNASSQNTTITATHPSGLKSTSPKRGVGKP